MALLDKNMRTKSRQDLKLNVEIRQNNTMAKHSTYGNV